MLAHQRFNCIENIRWNQFSLSPGYRDSIVGLECWKYENISYSQSDVTFRLVTLASEGRQMGVTYGHVEERLEQWLESKGPYVPPPAPVNAGKLQGGMRIVFCDRPGAAAGMSMSRHAFEAVEKAMMLHVGTLPSFFVLGGAYSSFNEVEPETGLLRRIQIVAKYVHKVQIANYLLSLSYDTSRSWTNAFVCGDSVTGNQHADNTYGNQLQQITEAIIASPELWTNLLFLPCVLLQNYTQRVTTRRVWTNREIIEVENKLGIKYRVTASGVPGIMRPEWPQDIDPKEITARIYSILPRNCVMNRCCVWLREYAQFLLTLEARFRVETVFLGHDSSFAELRDTITFLISVLNGLDGEFTAFKERASLQMSLLFSVISQQDSILNRWIAGSNKRDSISMTTFTFITALFLPGTFIATLFSMTMFDWQQGNWSSAQSSQGGNANNSYVSNKFWLFWVCAVPLTFVTMAGWYVWFKYASSNWLKDLRLGSVSVPLPVVDQRDEQEVLGPLTGTLSASSTGFSTDKNS